MRTTPSTPFIDLQDITVQFGSFRALDGVSLHLAPGVRHAVVGENGAGKSTLMKVLFGLLRPDEGQVLINGQAARLASPADAIARGVGMVHQHFELIAPFTVAENIVLGAEPTGMGMLNRREAEAKVARLAEESGLPINPRARVSDLSVASQQRVEILKALYRQAQVLILDEPTAVLAPPEARDLWAATARLSQAGTTVVFITHKLDEVMAHADEVTVLRRGKRISHRKTSDTNAPELASEMVGTNAQVEDRSVAISEVRSDKPVLQLANVSVRGSRSEAVVDNVSLDLYGGEIVGIAGVDGSGQIELIEAIMGLRSLSSGAIRLGPRSLEGLSVAHRREAGLGYVPEDRHHRAVVLPFGCEENAVLGRHREREFAAVGGRLRFGTIRQFLRERAEAFDVRGAASGVPIKSLSGGNQQKLVMARELSRRPQVLIASQPTRGLDFAASAFVHNALQNERNRGAAVLVQSLDLSEVLALSDRVAVMLRGQIAAVLSRADATEARIGELMTGVNATPTAPTGAATGEHTTGTNAPDPNRPEARV